MENRPETRHSTDLTVRVWGMGADGKAFFQNVHAHNISSDGALLSGLEHHVTAGDTIGVQIAEKKARCRVVWVIDAGPLQKIQIGVQLLPDQPCPWKEQLKTAQEAPKAASGTTLAGHNKRRFVRHKISFPLELRDERSGSAMQTSATDISGRGCYVETLLPLPFGTAVKITFWIESDKISTPGIVRTSDPGVGMGIEFTGLDLTTQERFQHLIEGLDPGSGFAGSSKTES